MKPKQRGRSSSHFAEFNKNLQMTIITSDFKPPFYSSTKSTLPASGRETPGDKEKEEDQKEQAWLSVQATIKRQTTRQLEKKNTSLHVRNVQQQQVAITLS